MQPDINEVSLLDWKRRISELYAAVRNAADPQTGWELWRNERDRLFREHPQSPLPAGSLETFGGLPYFGYDERLRVLASIAPADRTTLRIDSSGEEPIEFVRFARASFRVLGEDHALSLFWLTGYGGGVFLSFRDGTSGDSTYGAGRYLLDTVKGADLGMDRGKLVLDLNFAYNPSCSYDPKWVCPLVPPDNRLHIPVRAGERFPVATR